IESIRPLCLVPESMIKDEAQNQGFEKQKTPCPYDRVTKRKEVNDLFHQLEDMNPEARYSLWHSMKNIHPKLLV
ncbi:MAG: tRNA 2-thiocytidine(32) synthetase TtcA, partial [Prevotella sp.]|nr:tRNA 2-thiocytidine(32) synthetase TtcA [Prevotella sp.]